MMPPLARNIALAGGAALCLAAWSLPLDSSGLGHFSAHMARHMSVVALATPLLALGRPEWGARFPVSPLAATLFEFLVVWSWHLPALHDAARAQSWIFVAEQGSFLVAGWMIWSSALRPRGRLAGTGALLLTSMHMTLLGALLTLSPQSLYGGADAMRALEDQQLGGMVMLAIGTPVYLIAGLLLVARQLSEPGSAEGDVS